LIAAVLDSIEQVDLLTVPALQMHITVQVIHTNSDKNMHAPTTLKRSRTTIFLNNTPSNITIHSYYYYYFL